MVNNEIAKAYGQDKLSVKISVTKTCFKDAPTKWSDFLLPHKWLNFIPYEI
jgi:hypothetical protein